MRNLNLAVSVGVLTLPLLLGAAKKADPDPAMFGGTPSRNMVSAETGLPAAWDMETGHNIKWMEPIGSQTYGGPIVSNGVVYVGTNNEGRRNAKLDGDRGTVMAFQAADGKFLWQSAHPKLPSGMVNDWPMQGVCSTPYVEGNRIWYVSNRAEVVCADTEGFRDGENDGPFVAEKEKSDTDLDVVWSYDMISELDVFPHNIAAGNPLVVGDILFTVTGNGVDEGHVNIPAPFAPTFIALDKNTGELLWEDASPGEAILHGSWSNPASGRAGGREQVIIPGGNGIIYSFEPKTGKLIWKFDANPKDSKWVLGGRGTRNNVISTPVIHDGIVYIGVGQDPEHGEAPGHLWAIDATRTGDVTATGVIWHRGGEEFNRTISTVAIADGILYAADLSGYLYALDAKTGAHFWTYNSFAAVWSSPFVADGKVYMTDEDGDVAVLKAGKKMELLGEINMGNAIYTTPAAKDGVIYIATRRNLFAVQEGAGGKKEKPAAAKAAGGGD
jgi:outer membrane protein assembly factor BamB